MWVPSIALDRGTSGYKSLAGNRNGYEIVNFQSLNGSSVALDWLLDCNRELVRNSQILDQLPESEFVELHTVQVIRAPARY